MKGKLNLTRLSQAYIVGAAVFLVLAILSLLLMNDSSYQIVTNFWTSNNLASQTSAIFTPASRVIFSFEMRWALFALMILSMIVPLIYVYQINTKYKKLNLHQLRNLDWSITTAFMLVLVAVLSGVQDIATLLIVGSLVVLGYCLNRIVHLKDPDSLLDCTLSVIVQCLPWFLIIVYALGTLIYGDVRSPWYVYVLYLVGLIKLSLALVSSHWKMYKKKDLSETDLELHPVVHNHLVRVLFVCILIIGLKR